ncbi:MAG: sigma-54-dependent Fis family transcriptional regulator [Proteobacteria bacterium]|nr:sigma-54-dependent Fis family transcriptional regulator [Pseudomonadota bacterium]
MNPPHINILLVGAGSAGTLLLKLFSIEPTTKVIAVVDRYLNAPGIKLAKELGISTSSKYQKFINDEELEIIINVTGDQDLHHQLLHEKKTNTELIGGASAELMRILLNTNDQRSALKDRFTEVLKGVKQITSGEFITGKSPIMRDILIMIKQVAPTPITILIRGETGTGKEIISQMIHKNSPWSEKPLIAVNCTAFSAGLIESELFGYKKGAFTGAVSDRVGLIELADKGTIFLDEIGDMPLEMQSKLLRFLQSGEIRPVGSAKSKTVQVRVIAATNKDLETAIREGKFRQDLFYRLNGFTLTLPPLRDRKEDIPLLAYSFLKRSRLRVGKDINSISVDALNALTGHTWPGNLRELENVIERSVILSESDQIVLENLTFNESNSGISTKDREESVDGLLKLKQKKINQFEYEAICKYLANSKGNITHAAQSAKISRRTYHRLMEKHGITLGMFKSEKILPGSV